MKRKKLGWIGMGSGPAFKRWGVARELPRISNYYFWVEIVPLLASVSKGINFTEFESFNVKHLRPGWDRGRQSHILSSTGDE